MLPLNLKMHFETFSKRISKKLYYILNENRSIFISGLSQTFGLPQIKEFIMKLSAVWQILPKRFLDFFQIADEI